MRRIDDLPSPIIQVSRSTYITAVHKKSVNERVLAPTTKTLEHHSGLLFTETSLARSSSIRLPPHTEGARKKVPVP